MNRFKYSSMVTPRSIIDYNMSTRTTHVVKTQPVLGYDASKYETVRVFAPSHDGVKVPISLVYRKDLFKHDMSNPLMLVSIMEFLFCRSRSAASRPSVKFF